MPTVADKDILISFDGAVGRVTFGLVGAYSSGIYKVKLVDTSNYGIFYWALIDDKNQNIMLEHTNGTTILHGSKSIQYLLIKTHTIFEIDYFNNLFDSILNLKRETIKLQELKQNYLLKFFQ